MSSAAPNGGRSLRHRPRRTGPAIGMGLILLAGGVFLVWISAVRLFGEAWPGFLHASRDWLTALTWNDPAMWGVGVAAALLGLILMLTAVVPGAYNAMPVRSPGSETDASKQKSGPEVVMTRRGAARLASARCAAIDGVGSVSATATANRVHLTVDTPLHKTSQLQARIVGEVRELLAESGLEPLPKVTAAVRSRT